MQENIFIGNFDGKKYVQLRVKSSLYPADTLFAAGYVFLDRAHILLDQDKNNTIIYIYPKNQDEQPKQLGLDFLDELINYNHYFSRVKGNAEVIKTIMQRVMFSVNPKFAEQAEEQEIQNLLKELEQDDKKTPKAKKSKPKQSH